MQVLELSARDPQSGFGGAGEGPNGTLCESVGQAKRKPAGLETAPAPRYETLINFALFTWDLRTGATLLLGTIFGSRLWDGRLHDNGRYLSLAVGSKGGGVDRNSDYVCIIGMASGAQHCPQPEELRRRVGLWRIVGHLVEIRDRTAFIEYRYYESDKPVGPLSRIRYNLDDRTEIEVLETR